MTNFASFPRGSRADWVMFALETLTADRAGWRVVKEAVRDADGLPAGYEQVQKLKPLRPPSRMAEVVRFGYDAWMRRSWAVFRRLREEYGLPGLRFQLGVPTGFAMGFAFANRLAGSWPDSQRLEYVHFPLAEAAEPPRLEREFYRPLAEVRLPAGARFVAGFAHERRSLEQNRRILEHIESLRGETVDVAASCGLGRRTPEAALQVLELLARLTHPSNGI
jgi:hypothetical protein